MVLSVKISPSACLSIESLIPEIVCLDGQNVTDLVFLGHRKVSEWLRWNLRNWAYYVFNVQKAMLSYKDARVCIHLFLLFNAQLSTWLSKEVLVVIISFTSQLATRQFDLLCLGSAQRWTA